MSGGAGPIVSARGAERRFATPRGSIVAVAGVDLDVAAGECLAICGRSGSGKSTLLALLGGLCHPSAGVVSFHGRPWRAIGRAEGERIRAREIGFLFQSGGLLPGLRLIDNVALPRLLAGGTRHEAYTRAERLLDSVGLAGRWDAHPAELSGGQQRRAGLARALVNEPALILADEPTGDLDPRAAGEIIRLLVDERERHQATLVIVTHDEQVAAIADRALWMEGGRIAPLPAPPFERGAVPGRKTAAGVLPEAPAETGTAGIEATVFEPPPPMLLPSAPTPPGGEWQATALGLLAGAALSAAILAGADRIIARRQEAIVTSLRDQRRIAEEMALQDLRADLDDVVSLGTRRFRATMFLENQRRDRPLFVLGPSIAAAMQRDGSWNTFALDGNGTTGATVRPIEAAKTTIAVEFTLPEGSYDELIRGYLHVRFTASMVVSERDDGTGDLFERIDGYYVYLRDPALSEDDVRRLNEWPPGSTVPAWIAMPAH